MAVGEDIILWDEWSSEYGDKKKERGGGSWSGARKDNRGAEVTEVNQVLAIDSES